jgi:hypothetical protein
MKGTLFFWMGKGKKAKEREKRETGQRQKVEVRKKKVRPIKSVQNERSSP